MNLTKKQEKALRVWARWYSAKLDRINVQQDKTGKAVEGYSGAEQDLFEALGCATVDDALVRLQKPRVADCRACGGAGFGEKSGPCGPCGGSGKEDGILRSYRV